MPGQLLRWPAWPEHTAKPEKLAHEDDFARAKAAIIAEYGKEAIMQAWVETCARLETLTADIAARGTAAVPVLDWADIPAEGFTPAQRDQVRSTGCCVVRGVIPEDEARALFADLKKFVADNKDQISGWPAESPSMLNLYNSPTQVKIRTNPSHISLQRCLNGLFHDASGETSPEPLSYTDALRIRPPGQPFLGLGPHIDAGSLCRWADPKYRKVYDRIFSGEPGQHDAYDLGVRREADQFVWPASAHSVVFRSFQGWTALTEAIPECGSLMVYPAVGDVISYVLLRPFVAPPEDDADVMDGTKWTFDEASPWFPGTTVPDSQRLSTASHPHLRLKECLVHVPPMKPGDTVWWHTDMCHAVDPEHNGDTDASVVYVAACPTTRINRGYVKAQLAEALAGRPPPDCVGKKANEPSLRGYEGFDGVSEEGRAVLGFGL